MSVFTHFRCSSFILYYKINRLLPFFVIFYYNLFLEVSFPLKSLSFYKVTSNKFFMLLIILCHININCDEHH